MALIKSSFFSVINKLNPYKEIIRLKIIKKNVLKTIFKLERRLLGIFLVKPKVLSSFEAKFCIPNLFLTKMNLILGLTLQL